MTKPRRSGRRGPVVINDNAKPPAAARHATPSMVETPDGPLPGRLLVLLSRLHRTEQARASDPDGVAG